MSESYPVHAGIADAPRRSTALASLHSTATTLPEAEFATLTLARILPFPASDGPGFNGPGSNDTAAMDAPIAIPTSAPSLYRAGLKRAFDIVSVLASALLWLPLVLIAALMIMLRDGHTPFYTQDRIGRGGRVFRMIKLRSMVPDADAKLEAHLAADPVARAEWDATQKLKRDPRITQVGLFIRKCSIDELPQLINVLKGDMSVVGPRPFMVGQQEMYHGRRYYDMRPGLTGFWQISDRNECNFAQRVHFDNAYHRAVSFKTDLTVIFRTVGVILRGTGY